MPIYTNNKFNKKHKTNNFKFKAGIALVSVFSVLLILVASNLLPFLTHFFLGTFGIFTYVMFLMLIAFGALNIANKKITLSLKSTLFLVFSFITILCILHLATTLNLGNISYGKYLSYCFSKGTTAGGALTGILVYPVLYFTHEVASFVIFAIILTVLAAFSIVSIIADSNTNSAFVKTTKVKQEEKQVVSSYKNNIENTNPISAEVNNVVEENKTENNNSIFISDDEVNEEKTEREIEIETIKQMNKEKARAILWPEKAKVESYEQMETNKPLTPKEILFSSTIENKEPEQTKINNNYASYLNAGNKPQMFVHSNDAADIVVPDNNKTKQKRELTENERKNLEYWRATKGQFTINEPKEPEINEENDYLKNTSNNYSSEIYKAVEEYNKSADLFDETITKNNFKEKYYNPNFELENEETEVGLTNLSGYTNRTVSNSIKNDDKTNEVFFENNFRNVEEISKPEINEPKEPEFVKPNIFKPEIVKPEVKKQEVKKQEDIIVPKKPKPTKPYVAPPTDLLNYVKPSDDAAEDYSEKATLLEQTLESFKIPAKVVSIVKGPAVTRFELALPANQGISVKRVTSFADDIAMVLQAQGGIRIETPIPGKNAFGVEVPNKKISTVSMRDIIESETFIKNKSPLTIGIGKNITNETVAARMEKMPHLLVAGTTGSGKSVCLNVMLISWLYKASPDELKLILIDPKQVEFSLYNGLPHLLIPNVITDIDKAICALAWAIDEMERRFLLFKTTRVRNIEEYNERDEVKRKLEAKIPYIAIIVDEYGDIMSQNKKDVEDKIIRIAQKARAAGIHLVIATQRPSVDVITGIIKNNLPSRMAFKVSSYQDSRTILDRGGGENLLGYGDMLYMANGAPDPVRIQCAYVSGEEVERVVEFIKANNDCDFDSEIEDQMFNKKQPGFDASGNEEEFDPLLKDALRAVIRSKSVSISKIQRMFGVGYPKAGRIVDQMEKFGFISAADSKNQREIYITEQEFEDRFGEEF